jgi:FimV C-terminal domain/FimV N-terminal domain
MKLKRFTLQLVAAGLVAMPLLVQAAGLGRLTVTSALGQPLAAEIELLATNKSELDSLAANLASNDAFRDAHIDYSPVLSTLQFTVVKKPDGRAFLKVTSSKPVNDPFIDMLIELNWASGRLVREYTVLLDPPSVAAPQSVAPVVVAPAVTAPAATLKPAPAPVAPSASAPAKTEARAAPATKAASTTSVRVKSGDTLAAIARRVRPQGVAFEQALIGLYRDNTTAFIDQNINRLKAGKTLKVPSSEAMAAIDRGDAAREIKTQTESWQAYRRSLAEAVKAAPEAGEKAQAGQTASGKVAPKTEAPAKPGGEAAKDVLTLSKTGPTAAGSGKQAAAAAKEDDAAAREKTLEESSSRVSALEKQVADMQALVKLKEEAAKAKAAAAAQAAKPAAAPAAAKSAMPAVKAAEPPPVGDAWYAPFVNNPLYWGAGAALVALGGVLWWMMSGGRRRKSSTAMVEDSIMTGGDMQANSVIAGAAGGSINTGDTSFLTDFSQAGLGTIDTHDVDPIAEAEVYMAYGRDAQAEEILREAVPKYPERHEIRMKLLEIYAARRSPEAFQKVAAELHAALGSAPNKLWDKAVEMGREIDPSNPLYGGTGAPASTPSPLAGGVETVAATAAIAGGAMAFDSEAPAAPAPEAAPEPLPEAAPSVSDPLAETAPMNFESAGNVLDFDVKPIPDPAPDSTAADLDFDLSGLDLPDTSHNDLALDLGLDDDNGPDSKFDFSGLDLDLGDTGLDGAALDEVGTKLDLARAYVEMGDKEGAREILGEVLNEGNDKQKADAQNVLASIA